MIILHVRSEITLYLEFSLFTLVRGIVLMILRIGSLNEKSILLFSWGSLLTSLASGKEQSNFLGLKLGFLDVRSRVRAWKERLCVCGSLSRGQEFRDLKYRVS